MGNSKLLNNGLHTSSKPEDEVLLHSPQNPMATLPDADVWNRFRSGDEASFIYIYNEHFQALYQYGCQFTCIQELVEDAIQDLFVELRQKRKKITIKTSIRFYLFKSLKRKLIKLLEKRRKDLPYSPQPEYAAFEVTFSIEQRLIESQMHIEQRQKLAESIKKLTPRQREAIYYFYYENMSYAEIQKLMDFTHIQATRNLMYRAISELKKHLLVVIPAFIFN
ncbi:sigma-70 family RNA polymerase sigma factor [Fulvivirga sp. M361]|uniref:RNA polymerase sigma factor n=1 Tax=Fulvivirga sp. M361 TaxID=2594266 RepID=UPI00117B7599|nr:sigma-70 family RNA polymerase sigma factor [Fulvivirga sp. M361]TRX61693.1 sigma-70 family RNA polymerase sigma factor [Fulvivirga sp. M361]